MRMRFGVSLLATVLLTASVAAQGSPLDKLQAAQIPEEERAGLPDGVVAVLGSSRGWTREANLPSIKGIHITSPGRIVTESWNGIQLWDLDTMRLLDSTPAGNPLDFYGINGPSFIAGSADGKRLILVPPSHIHSDSLLGDPTRARLPRQPELWKIKGGKFTPVMPLYFFSEPFYPYWHSLEFLDQGEKLVVAKLFYEGATREAEVRLVNLSARPEKSEARVLLSKFALPDKHVIECVCLLPRGLGVAMMVQDGTATNEEPRKMQVVLVDWMKKKVTKTLALPATSIIKTFRVSADQRRMITLAEDSRIRVYDLAGKDAKLVYVSAKTRFFSNQLAWDPEGRTLAYIGTDVEHLPGIVKRGEKLFSLRLVDLTAPAPKDETIDDDNNMGFEALAMTPDGKTLLVGDSQSFGRIQAWDLTGAKPSRRNTSSGHQAAVNRVAFTPDAKSLLTGGFDRKICLWDFASGKPVLAQTVNDRARVQSLTSAPGGKLWASAGTEPNGVSLWKLDGGKLALAQQLEVQPHAVGEAAFSNDGQSLYAAAMSEFYYDHLNAGEQKKKDANSGLSLWRLKGDRAAFQALITNPKGDIFTVAASPVSKLVIAAGGLQTRKNQDEFEEVAEVVAWDFSGSNPKMIASLPGHKNIVRNAVFSPNGKLLATASGDANIRLWHVNGNDITPAKVLNEQDSNFAALAFSPDGQSLLAWDTVGEIMLWDVKTGDCIHSWRVRHRINSLAFAPDGRHFATGNPWGTAYIFRLPPQKQETK